MERTIKDVMTRVQGLLGRVEQQSTEATVTELRAIHIARSTVCFAPSRGDDYVATPGRLPIRTLTFPNQDTGRRFGTVPTGELARPANHPKETPCRPYC
jgi:hypothetical protein